MESESLSGGWYYVFFSPWLYLPWIFFPVTIPAIIIITNVLFESTKVKFVIITIIIFSYSSSPTKNCQSRLVYCGTVENMSFTRHAGDIWPQDYLRSFFMCCVPLVLLMFVVVLLGAFHDQHQVNTMMQVGEVVWLHFFLWNHFRSEKRMFLLSITLIKKVTENK